MAATPPLRALTVRNPKHYLAGAINGDAYIAKGGAASPRGNFGLTCIDHDFALTFAAAIRAEYGIVVRPRRNARGYWETRTYNGYGRFDDLRALPVTSDAERAAWVRGLFDSEGTAFLAPHRHGPGSYQRHVTIVSTNTTTLGRAREYLLDLDIPTRTHARSLGSPGHYGTKQVHELQVRGARENYDRFAQLVGSSIQRKQETLIAIVASYCADLGAARRAPRRTSHRGDIAVHAGAEWFPGAERDPQVARAWWGGDPAGKVDPAELDSGWYRAVVAVADLYDCHVPTPRLLRQPLGRPCSGRPLVAAQRPPHRPRACQGALGLWTLPPAIAERVAANA